MEYLLRGWRWCMEIQPKMTLAITRPGPQTKADSAQEKPLVKRIDSDSITNNERKWILKNIAEKLQHESGRCNLNSYVRINQYYDIEEIIGDPNLRRLYKEHSAETGRIREIDLYDFSGFKFVEKIKNSKEKLTACFVLQGSPTLEYMTDGFHIPIALQEGNIFMWDSEVKVGFDDIRDSRVVIYGIR
jgi:hypothetical protein